MTEQERIEKQAELIKAKKAEIKERIASEIKDGYLNPFGEGVSYNTFLKAVKESKKSVADYCKGKLTDAELAWLENELSILKTE